MQEAVVFEASPAEQSVEGVKGLLSLYRLGKGPIHVRGAEGGQLDPVGGLQQILVPVMSSKREEKNSERKISKIENLHQQFFC